MKKIFYMITILLLLQSTTYATSEMGSIITYTHLSGNQYLIKVTFYRDCSGIFAPQSIKVCYSSTSCGAQDSIILPVIGTGFILPDFPLIPPVITSCVGGPGFGMERWVYSDTLDLPFLCNDWNLSFTSGMLAGPGGTLIPNFYTSTKIDNVTFQNNSSIELIFDPVFLYCVQQTGYNDLSSTDADGDSIVYSFSQILVDSTICPLNSSLAPPISNYHLNSMATVNPNAIGVNSGLMIINNPTIVQIGTVSVLIKEYRNGVNINQTIFQQIVACIAGCLNSGVNEITNNGIIISPNPVNDQLVIEFVDSEADIEIFNITGQRINLHQIESNNVHKLFYDATNLNKGVYLITFTDKKSQFTKRFVKL